MHVLNERLKEALKEGAKSTLGIYVSKINNRRGYINVGL